MGEKPVSILAEGNLSVGVSLMINRHVGALARKQLFASTSDAVM